MGYATRLFKKRKQALLGPKISRAAEKLMKQHGITLEDIPAGATEISVREVREAIFSKSKPKHDGNQKESHESEEE